MERFMVCRLWGNTYNFRTNTSIFGVFTFRVRIFICMWKFILLFTSFVVGFFLSLCLQLLFCSIVVIVTVVLLSFLRFSKQNTPFLFTLLMIEQFRKLPYISTVLLSLYFVARTLVDTLRIASLSATCYYIVTVWYIVTATHTCCKN